LGSTCHAQRRRAGLARRCGRERMRHSKVQGVLCTSKPSLHPAPLGAPLPQAAVIAAEGQHAKGAARWAAAPPRAWGPFLCPARRPCHVSAIGWRPRRRRLPRPAQAAHSTAQRPVPRAHTHSVAEACASVVYLRRSEGAAARRARVRQGLVPPADCGSDKCRPRGTLSALSCAIGWCCNPHIATAHARIDDLRLCAQSSFFYAEVAWTKSSPHSPGVSGRRLLALAARCAALAAARSGCSHAHARRRPRPGQRAGTAAATPGGAAALSLGGRLWRGARGRGQAAARRRVRRARGRRGGHQQAAGTQRQGTRRAAARQGWRRRQGRRRARGGEQSAGRGGRRCAL
jgi:hypothetical protein